jgi:hypothetical protein
MICKTCAEQLFTDLNPVPDPGMTPLDQQAAESLDTILASPQAHPNRSPKIPGVLRWVVAAATAAVAVGGIQLLTSNEASFSSFPPLIAEHPPIKAGASTELLRIANQVATLPDDTGVGATATLKTQGSFLDIDGEKNITIPRVVDAVDKVQADGHTEREETTTKGSTDTEKSSFKGILLWGFGDSPQTYPSCDDS